MSHPDGRYILGGLRPGQYRLRIADCAGVGQPAGGVPISYSWPGMTGVVTVTAGQVSTLPTAAAWREAQYGLGQDRSGSQPASARAATGSISGRVTGHGHPLRDICAFAVTLVFGNSNVPLPRATTSGTGRYRIGGLRPGRYFVEFRTGEGPCRGSANWLPQWYPYVTSPYATGKAAQVRVRAGKDTGQINGKLRLGGEIAGVVRTKAGKPVRGVCASMYSPVTIGGLYSVSAASGQTGRYALHGLFPGKYQIEFSIGCGTAGNYAAQWWPRRPSPAHAKPVSIRGRQIVSGIDAVVVRGAAITGTVRARTAAAKPLGGICVSAADDQGNYAAGKTAKDGNYRLEGLDTGTYQVTFDPTCSGFVNADYLPAQRTVRATAGRTRSGINAYLRPAAGISGVVRDSAGKPVDSVCVNVEDDNNDYGSTNANGTYLITGIVPGTYAVNFETDCGSPGSLAGQWYDNQSDSDSANSVTLTAGKVARNVDATLQPGGTLAGVLTSASGQPVNGDCIGLVAPHDSLQSGSFSGGGFTARDGRYRLADLDPGEYQVSFNCDSGRYADEWFRSQPDSSTAAYLAINPGVTTTLNQKLARAGSIAGTVTGRAGHPLSNICISVANARNGQFIDLIDGGPMTYRGRYIVGQLAPGRYLVQFVDCGAGAYGSQWYRGKDSASAATPVTVRAGGTTTGINAALTIGGSISGTVTGPSGKPANGTCVQVYDAASQFYGYGGTNKAGRYAIGGLSDGPYSVSFYDCFSFSPDLSSVIRPGLVHVVAPRAAKGIDIQLAAGGSISGTVSSAPGSPGPQAQACVVAVPTNPQDMYQLEWTDAGGHYVLPGRAAATYRVYLDDPLCDFYDFGAPDQAPQWYDDQPGQAAANLVTVAAGHTTSGISATLQPFGTIKGTVTTAGRAGVAGECVTADPFRAAADPVSGLAPPADIAITRPAGRYQLPDLTPGQYKIEFSTGCGDAGFATQWWNDATSAKSATVVTVGPASITTLNATLSRA
jgi:hypothetical protein